MAAIDSQRTSVTFNVSAICGDNEELCVVGGASELGAWKFGGAVPLTLIDATSGTWTIEVALPSGVPVEYIYIVRHGSTMRRRESFVPHHRVLVPNGTAHTALDGAFGVHPDATGDFRTARSADGILCDDVQLRVWLGALSIDGTTTPGIRLFDESAAYIANFHAASPSAVPANLAQWTAFNKRTDLDAFVFNASTRDDLSFYIDVEVRPSSAADNNNNNNNASDASVVRGRVHVLARDLVETRAEIRRPIIDTELRVIGEATLQYLVAMPLRHARNDLRHSSAGFRIPASKCPAVVGHRGAGATNNPRPHASLTENTLMSFLAAARDGAEFVEFDVQLSKDCVPVIVHDEEIEIKSTGSTGQDLRTRTPVNKVMFGQLRQMQPIMPKKPKDLQAQLQAADLALANDPQWASLAGASPCMRKFSTLRRSSMSDLQSRLCNFPSLEELFEFLPADLGFNVEIKYPFSSEFEKYIGVMERNEYVDRILSVMLDFAEDRKVYISSFDPEVCLLCSLKQSRFPVFLLTTGGLVYFRHPAKNSLDAAIRFAESARLCGVVSDASAVLDETPLVQRAHAAGLMLFTYGGHNKIPAAVRLQALNGVDGIITDTITDILPAVRPSAHESEVPYEDFTASTKQRITEDDLMWFVRAERPDE